MRKLRTPFLPEQLMLATIIATAHALVVIPEPTHTSDWTSLGRAPWSRPMSITIALKEQNTGKLDRLVSQIGDPRSPAYTSYLTTQELVAMTATDKADVDTVQAWLASAGVAASLSPVGTSLRFRTNARTVGQLFNTSVRLLFRNDTGQTASRAGDLHLPSSVGRHIAAVYGCHGLPIPHKRHVFLPLSTFFPVTPSVLSATYNISGVEPNRAASTNKQAVVEFQGQHNNDDDLATFFKQYVPKYSAGDDKVYKYVGPTGGRAGTEALLDIQYMMGVSPGIKTEFWYFDGTTDEWCAALRNWTDTAIADPDRPLVFSVSYGVQGNVSLHRGCGGTITADLDTQFMKLAALGVSIMFSSGDDGSGGIVFGKDTLWDVWPGSAPHVVSVGATMFGGQRQQGA